VIDFRGPSTPVGRGLRPRRDETTFFKNLHFPRHFFAPRGKYVVEDMEDSIYKKYGIDPNRVPTDAEVELVAFCFGVSREEARLILATRRRLQFAAMAIPDRATSTTSPSLRTELVDVRFLEQS